MCARPLRSIFVFAMSVLCAASCVLTAFVAPRSRIVGGLPANDVNIPYIVSLVTYGFHSCGGSILNERTVVTAAHCLAFTTARWINVHAGTKMRSLSEGDLVPVQSLHYHEEWSMDTMDYDIGLVRLVRPLIFSVNIQPIALAKDDYLAVEGSLATVAGWGYVSMLGPGAEMLRYARVPIINQNVCDRQLGGGITERMICAGFIAGGIDACQMDSGGPLVIEQRLVGIVSWGIGCALPNKPGVYTRITELLPWLKQTLSTEYNEVL